MNNETDDRLSMAQAEVERLFGQCLFRLQRYELTVKAILADHRHSVSTATGEEQTALATKSDRQTLGPLLGQMMGSFIVAGKPEPAKDLSDGDLAVVFQVQIGLRPDDFAKAEVDLRELVALRNKLVHHFLEEHDLCSSTGCETARFALVEASARISRATDDLRVWVADLVKMRTMMLKFMNSEDSRDVLAGKTIPRPMATIVQALREAETVLARDGWTPLQEAAAWITKRYPHERPVVYRCRSWRQVVHETRLFDLRYHMLDDRREARYRSRTGDRDPR